MPSKKNALQKNDLQKKSPPKKIITYGNLLTGVIKILYKITNEHRILYKIVILISKKKAKTTNNGSFLKLFKTLTARVLSSLKILRLRLEIFKLDKALPFVFKHVHYCWHGCLSNLYHTCVTSCMSSSSKASG